MTGAPRGRGRPVQFTADTRQRYLTALAAGASQKTAAAELGITPRTVQLAAKADPVFAAACRTARDTGRAQRAATAAQRLPHGEARYNHAHCHCDTCTREASEARAGRRHNAEPVRPVPLRVKDASVAAGSFPLAAAS